MHATMFALLSMVVLLAGLSPATSADRGYISSGQTLSFTLDPSSHRDLLHFDGTRGEAGADHFGHHFRPDRPQQEFDLPLVIRVALVLTYLRLHIPQQAVACMYKAATQSDVSRELRRLLPLIKQVLPCPEVWEMVEAGEALSETELLALEQLADGLVLIDATEPQVYRPGQSNAERLKYFSG